MAREPSPSSEMSIGSDESREDDEEPSSREPALVRRPHTRTPLTSEARALLAVIRDALAAGQDVRLPGLGVLRVEAHAARMGRNPRTGDAIAVPAGKRVHFSRSREMHALLNP